MLRTKLAQCILNDFEKILDIKNMKIHICKITNYGEIIVELIYNKSSSDDSLQQKIIMLQNYGIENCSFNTKYLFVNVKIIDKIESCKYQFSFDSFDDIDNNQETKILQNDIINLSYYKHENIENDEKWIQFKNKKGNLVKYFRDENLKLSFNKKLDKTEIDTESEIDVEDEEYFNDPYDNKVNSLKYKYNDEYLESLNYSQLISYD